MQQSSDVGYLVGSSAVEAALPGVAALPPFSEAAVAFLAALSERVRRDEAARAYADVVTFGFWCRRASLLQQKARYDDLAVRLGRGVVFHVAPSNVAVNFAYSCAAALLAGNASIVRLPSKAFAQTEILCRLWRETLAEEPQLAPYFLFVRYGHEEAVNARYSALADTRVVWGGDETIRRFRQFPLTPRANEITFADRFSLAVLDSDAYLAYDEKERLAQSFYDDTYLSDQQACTSPHLVVWIGRACAEARPVFWRLLHARVRDRYELAPVQVVDKFDALLRLAAAVPVHQVPMEDMRIVRAEVESLTAPLANVRTGSGFFVEYVAKSLQELRPVLGTAVQTVAYFGIPREQILEAVREMRPRGVDRIVPIGRTMDFSLMWDGYDLIRSMSRRVDAL